MRVLLLCVVVAVSVVQGHPQGIRFGGPTSRPSSAINFGTSDRRRPGHKREPVNRPQIGMPQFPESSNTGHAGATSEQGTVQLPSGGSQSFSNNQAQAVSQQSQGQGHSSGSQTSDVQAVSENVQVSPGGAVQSSNNAALIEAAQQGGGSSTSNNQVIINTHQEQNNFEGPTVVVDDKFTGPVVVNVDKEGANIHQPSNTAAALPQGQRPSTSAGCIHWCRHGITGKLYCCNDGSFGRAKETINAGQCPEKRLICLQNQAFRITKCSHDGYCNQRDKCCWDSCVDRHICKPAV